MISNIYNILDSRVYMLVSVVHKATNMRAPACKDRPDTVFMEDCVTN